MKTKGLPHQTVQFQFAANKMRQDCNCVLSELHIETALANLESNRLKLISMVNDNYSFFQAQLVSELNKVS